MNTEETAFMYDSAGDAKRENRAISKFFEYLEEEGFTVQQVKNIVSRINDRITSASIACDMRTPFQKKRHALGVKASTVYLIQYLIKAIFV